MMVIRKSFSKIVLITFFFVVLESDNESIMSTNSLNQFSFDIRSVLDDDRRHLLKKYRETKKKVKASIRRQADQGKSFNFLFENSHKSILFLFIFRNSNTFR